ncbi:EF-P 5-aminopentanol modification-associated protein YfmF [Paenibacillus oceani]|uniref:Insulinase family protein n=1 Tax=Paenibacillus oceani TaxID=2772510 RepID=A0A927C603_9BACL|nr:pitrilysin family protein [Paenibacillus oceani]MBD2862004.1 insulinase family protein [Paenibacillus oceani]
MNKSAFERDTVGNVRLHVLPTDQFKTYAISVYIGRPLNESSVTPVALTPFVLRRGTSSLPETKQFRERQDDLYGAGFGFDIYKRGDYQIVQFRMDMIHDDFVSDSGSMLEQALQFVGEAITDPVLENGAFRTKYVEAEKDTLRKRIEAIINDKIRYAAERCMEEMCKNEPYRLHPLGKVADMAAITPESLYASYKQWLAESPIDVYVVGNTTLAEVKPLVEAAFKWNRPQSVAYNQKPEHRQVEQVNTVVERLDVTQGKLNMGLRTYVTYSDDDYPAMLMYNGILGGYPHSKLFLNVREKESLAYYASSRLDGHKGILTIQSGIEFANYEKAVDIIQKQIAQMNEGQYSDLELSQTRAMISNQLRESQDSAYETISLDFNNQLSGKVRSAAELIEQIGRVDVEAIRRVAQGVKLDTVYFLRDRKGE